MGCTHSSQRVALAPPSPRPAVHDPSVMGASTIIRPNAPLRLPRNFRSGTHTPRRRSALDREREAFFETRVTGRPELWQAVRLAVELIREQRDIATAQGVLDAAGLTVPRGRLEEGIWDEHGELYRVDNWVVADPRDLVEDAGLEVEDIEHKVEMGPQEVEREQDAIPIKTNGTIVKIRIRLSDRGTDIIVQMSKEQSMDMLKKLIRDQAKISQTTLLKLVYLGKVLPEAQSLANSGWQEGHVISALISELR